MQCSEATRRPRQSPASTIGGSKKCSVEMEQRTKTRRTSWARLIPGQDVRTAVIGPGARRIIRVACLHHDPKPPDGCNLPSGQRPEHCRPGAMPKCNAKEARVPLSTDKEVGG